MSFGDFLDKFKSSTKQAAEQMKLAGRIAALKVEKTTQKTEHDRLLKEIGSKTYAIYLKTKRLNEETLTEEVVNELEHLDRIDKRLDEIVDEISRLQSEILKTEGKEVVDAEAEVDDEDEDDDDDDDNDEDDEKEVKRKR